MTKKKHPTEAEIQAMIASDPDNPEWTDDEMARAKPFAEVFPTLAESARKSLGRPKSENPKVAVSLRLDAEVVEAFKRGGDGWQTRMNAALRKAAHLR